MAYSNDPSSPMDAMIIEETSNNLQVVPGVSNMKARSLIGLRHLRTFLEITQHDNLVKASKALNIAHSAVYRTLQELELQFGMPLIERGHKSVVLTAAGEILRVRAAEVLASFTNAMDAVQSTKMKQEILRIGTLPAAAGLLLPAAVARMQREASMVRVRICSGSFKNLVAALRMGDLDMIVGRLAGHDAPGLSFEKLYEEETVAVCRTGHPFTSEREISLDCFEQFPLIVPPCDHVLRISVEDYFRAEGLALPACIESTSDTFSRSFVVKSDAIWFAPPGAVALELELGLLAKLQIGEGLPLRPVGVTTCVGSRMRPCSKLFVRFLTEASAELKSHGEQSFMSRKATAFS
ncbi:LysR substrate-binding domain-containing protein [Xanthobacteraceae bacterium Astr-EGSB]|uniref:LysR substrate-binding domain-containing protein n=1 Tax=Astrobacterium formosum TaxID=3069710 RepID=UPI0027B428D6|nr:LysR substrate-binding domain-containing protein [Xanthobacteraceae bacterium Astr-EGSB]